ncbi:MAG TPA: phosphoadenylyl-sulfate reductase [Flavobacteriales bacterium]|nr:phosphoadenylyl-sulfate reductase [Flavobacteriales bacterium]HIA11027.1 phosphoadenylyl-sulfate reductase [Flavobacteriales bacterium]HIO73108.1 phosphoadenylyl-sulfate reductase [Flavobacteriales bacterium]
MEIKERLAKYRSEGLKIFASSSFQTQSVVLLHLISRIDKSIPIYFLNTGFHFSETLEYKAALTKLFDLHVIDLFSEISKIQQRNEAGRMLYTSDPDYCCYLNKVQPLEPVMKNFDIWISGVRSDQNTVRGSMSAENQAQHGVTRYHPMLGWTGKMIYDYIDKHKLPKHPLDGEGYFSIGCQPCTIKMQLTGNGKGRDNRWYGQNKTECGIHTELVVQ